MIGDNGLYVTFDDSKSNKTITVSAFLPKDENCNGSVKIMSHIVAPKATNRSTLAKLVHHYNILLAASSPGFMELNGDKIVWCRYYRNHAFFAKHETVITAIIDAKNVLEQCDKLIGIICRFEEWGDNINFHSEPDNQFYATFNLNE